MKVIALLLTALSLSAQAPPTQIDPFALQQRVNVNPKFDVAVLWRDLGIPAQLETVYQKVGARWFDDGNFDHCNRCTADLTQVNLDNEPDNEVVVHLHGPGGYRRFLVFKRNSGIAPASLWRFIGHADHDFSRYYEPKYRVENADGIPYFVTNVQGTSGTGVSLQYERWYQVTPTGFREVLSFPAMGSEYSSSRSANRSFEAKVDKTATTPDQLSVQFTVQHSGNYFLVDETKDEELPLFSRAQTGIYVRGTNSPEFTLRSNQATITTKEIQTVYNIDSLTCGDFLSFNMPDLLKITQSPKSKTTEWLSKYLAQCEPSAERTALLKVLN